jgi:hypothetical protein
MTEGVEAESVWESRLRSSSPKRPRDVLTKPEWIPSPIVVSWTPEDIVGSSSFLHAFENCYRYPTQWDRLLVPVLLVKHIEKPLLEIDVSPPKTSKFFPTHPGVKCEPEQRNPPNELAPQDAVSAPLFLVIRPY